MKENLFFLPPYEDAATAEQIKKTYGYPIRYMTRYLIDFFTALRKEQHHIYVLLDNLPLKQVAVVRTYDRLLYWNNRNVSDIDGYLHPCENYTLSEFLAKKKQFHRIDYFELYVLKGRFTDSKYEVPSQKVFKKLYRDFLREECERRLRQNSQLILTPEIIQKYGLTDADVGKIRPYLNRFNREAKAKIQDEYDNLARLDFINRHDVTKTNAK